MSETNGEKVLPANNLPEWEECKNLVESNKGSHLHKFIYEYDDASNVGSAWFLHRLELVINEAREAAIAELKK